MSMSHVDAFSTPGITPPPAFHRLRRDLHNAAGPDRIACSRTKDTITQLRHRAAFFREAVEVYAGTGLGYWYAELATRLLQEADEIETTAKANGIIA